MFPLILLILCVFLLFAFITFDQLVKTEYSDFSDEWFKDGKPRGIFWSPPGSTMFSGWGEMYRISFLWLFKTPAWAREDINIRPLFKRLRFFVLIWCAGVLSLAVINLINWPAK